MKIKLNKVSVLLTLIWLAFSCTSKKDSNVSDFIKIETMKDFYKEVKFIKNGNLIQKMDSLGGTNWNSNTNSFDTTFYINSINLYMDKSNFLLVKYLNNQPSAIFYSNSEKKDTLFFDYPLNYHNYVSLKQELSWNDPIVQNGVELLVKYCSNCHLPRLLNQSTVGNLDTTNVVVFRKNMEQIHTNLFADSIINAIPNREFNTIRKIIKNVVERKAIY